MARRSRNIPNCVNKIVWKIGIYLRLSSEDGDNAESDSIKNQRELINYFLKKEDNVMVVDYYVDDGYSGTSFNRPGFKKMFNDIVNEKINAVIVKDLSRFGRNYIEVGNYLEQIFPLYNLRFIAINDNVDSFKDPKSINNVIVPFKNLMNDEYARDISNKVKSSLTTMARNGEFTRGTAPYGYMLDPNKKHHLVINNDEVQMVKKIFEMALNNDGKIKICKYLNNNKILCRKEVQRRKKYDISLNPDDDEIKYKWSTSSIGRMLQNGAYIGNLVQNKTGNISYKNHREVPKPKEEWIRAENTHEPIISKKDFDKVQELIKSKNTRKKKATNFSIYNGKLKCADCGKAMYKMEDTRKGRTVSNYYCMSHKLTCNDCSPHKIKTSILDSMILENIVMHVKMVMSMEKVLNKIKNSSENKRLEEEYKNNIFKLSNDIDKLKKLKKSSYEDWKLKKISKEEYLDYSKDYDERIKIFSNDIKALENVYTENIKNTKKDDYWIEHFRRNQKVKSLSKDVINELIDLITVNEDGNVTIIFKYQDEYEKALEFIQGKEELLNG